MAGLRRPHTKSRKGCRECKRRKVKCDEIHPSCFSCTRYGVSCSYSFDNLKPKEVWSPPGGCTPAVVHDCSLTEVDLLGNPSVDSHLLNDSSITDSGVSWVRDLELMHHYCTVTSATMAHQEVARHVWRTIFPQEGYRHAYVMHGVLSLAALHKAFLIPDKRDIYLMRSAFHHSTGQKSFTALLPNVTSANWRPVFCFATIIIAYVLSLPLRTDQESDPDVTPISRTLELFSVTKGIKAILLPFIPQLNHTNLAPLVNSVWLVPVNPLPDPKPSLEYSLIPDDVFCALSKLRRFVLKEKPLENAIDYEKSISILEISAVQIGQADVNVEVGAILLWPFFLPDSVIIDIRERKPYALVVLAHYAVFLHALDRIYWFLRGWGSKLIEEICDQLEDQDQWMEFLEWPRIHIRS